MSSTIGPLCRSDQSLALNPLDGSWFARFDHVLPREIVEQGAQQYLDDLQYERIDYAGLTMLWVGQRTCGDAYFGELLWNRPPSAAAIECARLFETPWLLEMLADLAGCCVELMRPATPYLMRQGDRICLHDDMSDPRHALSVVLGLTRSWCEGDGGETIIGEVASVEDVETPPEIPFQLRRWSLSERRAVLPPAFNALTVLRLSTELAHGVNPVLSETPRLSLVALYGRVP